MVGAGTGKAFAIEEQTHRVGNSPDKCLVPNFFMRVCCIPDQNHTPSTIDRFAFAVFISH